MHQNDRLEVSRDAISRLPLVVWETDLEGRLVGSASGGGVRASEPGEKCLVDVLESDGRLQDVIQGVLDGGSVAFEQQVDGSVYRVSIGPRCDGDGRVIGASGVGIDVTAERAAMDTADARDQQIRLLVDTALDAVITCDPDSRIVVWNTGAEQLFGWSREEAVGRRLTDTIIPTEYVEAHNRGMARFVETGEGPVLGTRIEIEAQDRNGRRFPVELSINPIPTPSGLSFSGFIRDISARKASERAAREDEERLSLALDAIDAGAWDYTLSADGRLEASTVSARTTSILGADAKRTPPDRASLHPEDRQGVEDRWASIRSGQADAFTVEYRLNGEDGRERWVSEHGRVFESTEEGAARRVVGVVSDISRRRAMEETLLATQKTEALGAIAGGFAHDLNNVLAAIRGHASLASLETEVPRKVTESLDVIQAAVTRGRSLTQNMMMLGSPTRIRRSVIDVTKICHETLALVRPAVPASVSIGEHFEAGDHRILADGNQFQQAVLNLVVNARDAVSDSGKIDVSVDRTPAGDDHPSRIVIAVRDDGAGMDEEVRLRAIEPFYTTKGRSGNGLGLAMVKNFVDGCKGVLEIESTPGTGTVVSLVLPEVETSAVPNATGGDASAADRSASRVLLAEDHPLLRPMLLEAMTVGGFEVRDAADAATALKISESWTPTVLVLDVNLPGETGDVIAARIREERGDDVPVVFITGNNEFEAPDWESVKLLRKPFGLDELMTAIDQLIMR